MTRLTCQVWCSGPRRFCFFLKGRYPYSSITRKKQIIDNSWKPSSAWLSSSKFSLKLGRWFERIVPDLEGETSDLFRYIWAMWIAQRLLQSVPSSFIFDGPCYLDQVLNEGLKEDGLFSANGNFFLSIARTTGWKDPPERCVTRVSRSHFLSGHSFHHGLLDDFAKVFVAVIGCILRG